MKHWRGIIGLLLLALAGWLLLRQDAPPAPMAGRAGQARVPATPAQASTHASAHQTAPLALADFAATLCNDPQTNALLARAPGNDSDQAELWQQPEGMAARAALEAFLQQAGNSTNLQQRAAAWFMHAQWQAQQLRRDYLRNHPNCANEIECGERARENAASAGAADANKIAQLAVNSPDPLLYATAFHACRSFVADNSGFCQQISAAQWAARDPNNGIAWLHVASSAGQTEQGRLNDEGENALFRLAQATTFDQGLSALPKLRIGNPAPLQNGLAQLALIQLNNALYLDLSLPTYGRVSNHCNPEQLNDANRRQICETIAGKLVGDQSSMLGFSVGAALGRRLGWSAQRLATLQQERDAFQGFLLEMDKLPGAPQAACQKRLDAAVWLENSMQYGEMAEFRARLARTPGALDAWAARYRASLQKDTGRK
jgi:hypothetical protein